MLDKYRSQGFRDSYVFQMLNESTQVLTQITYISEKKETSHLEIQDLN